MQSKKDWLVYDLDKNNSVNYRYNLRSVTGTILWWKTDIFLKTMDKNKVMGRRPTVERGRERERDWKTGNKKSINKLTGEQRERETENGPFWVQGHLGLHSEKLS